MLPFFKYDKLRQADQEEEKKPALHMSSFSVLAVAFFALFIYSSGVVLFALYLYNPSGVQQLPQLSEQPTKYAGLVHNTPVVYGEWDDFVSEDRAIQDNAWRVASLVDGDNIIALDHDHARALGLPHSLAWPWDANKEIYLLASTHKLHCASAIRNLINAYYDNSRPPALPYEHALHCANILRASVMCEADDQPLALEQVALGHNRTATVPRRGQTTVCRDWEALSAWSRGRSACYRPGLRAEDGLEEIERFKHCPDGSRPWEGL